MLVYHLGQLLLCNTFYDSRKIAFCECIISFLVKDVSTRLHGSSRLAKLRLRLQKEYVYLHASSQSAAIQIDERRRLLLSHQAGYTFMQTDKHIYTPNQEVFIRLVSVDQQMRPSQEKVRIDILTPQDIIVKRFDELEPDSGFVSVKYQFPGLPAFGNWTVAAYYGHERMFWAQM
ncbi:complement C3-like [Amphiura filiformis]|uniref:complement C3-like n=1 Tax=Amphiura filiformis TaxID=82378 RepID=UPI003B21F686